MTRIVVVVVVLTAAAAAQGFDPYKKQIVDYGVPKDFPGNPHHDQLTCFYYRGLMVKQLTNQWNKGALYLSFLRFDQAQPACVKEHSPAEKVLDYSEWSGYFRGLVKGDLIFFDADDGENGGMPFAVYDSKTRKKIFEDNAYYVAQGARCSHYTKACILGGVRFCCWSLPHTEYPLRLSKLAQRVMPGFSNCVAASAEVPRRSTKNRDFFHVKARFAGKLAFPIQECALEMVFSRRLIIPISAVFLALHASSLGKSTVAKPDLLLIWDIQTSPIYSIEKA